MASTRWIVAACSGVAQRGPGEQGPDGGQPVVAGAGAVAAVVFEVVQERGDQRGVEVGDVELAGVLPGALGGEGQQQPPGVPVAGDGVAAGAALADEPV